MWMLWILINNTGLEAVSLLKFCFWICSRHCDKLNVSNLFRNLFKSTRFFFLESHELLVCFHLRNLLRNPWISLGTSGNMPPKEPFWKLMSLFRNPGTLLNMQKYFQELLDFWYSSTRGAFSEPQEPGFYHYYHDDCLNRNFRTCGVCHQNNLF